MIVPRMPPEVLPLPGAVVPVGEGEAGGVEGGVELGGGGELLLGGAEVCLDFDGVAEDGWPPGLEDFPDIVAPGV
jgi:hypothetical protein